jgi:hypothetical protein
MTKTPRVLLQYDIVDEQPNGRLIRETHRWVIPGDTQLADVLEHIDNLPYVDCETVRVFGVTETEEF